MKKNIARLLLVAVLVAMLAAMPSGVVLAKPPSPDTSSPTCQFTSAGGYTGNAPFTVTLTAPYVNSGNYNWHFGDNSPGATEQTVTHTYNGVGRYTLSLVVIDNQHIYRGCSIEVNVTQGETEVVVPATSTPAPESTTTADVNAKAGTTNKNNEGVIIGDNNIAPNGDNNVIIVQTAPAVVTQPVTVQKTNWFTAFIHAFLKASEAFIHTLDESWFQPVPVN